MSFVVASLLALLISISAFSARVDCKPLHQNQIKFRRLPPKEFSAALGSSITIECEAGGSPPPSIHWLKNGKRILQNEFDENQLEDSQAIQVDEINRIALSSTRSRLFIDCASFEDEAEYTCVAENAYSRISSKTSLNLIKPLGLTQSGRPSQLGAAGNDLLAGTLEEVEGAAGEKANQLAAIPQCLSQKINDGGGYQSVARIHMWTHNIVEVMKNNIVLYCRSNLKKPQATTANINTLLQSQDTDSDLKHQLKPIAEVEATLRDQQQQQEDRKSAFVSWTLPDDKMVGPEHKNKYEILETGDLLITDLRWTDMGSYVCTVSDEQSSDSISTFVYPAASKVNSKRSTLSPTIGGLR